jgi:flagellar protein FlbT
MSSFKIFLKANERIYINGAVIRVDRKVSLELLNDVQFLLENHVLQAEDATTPLAPALFHCSGDGHVAGDKEAALPLFRESLPALIDAFSNQGSFPTSSMSIGS